MAVRVPHVPSPLLPPTASLLRVPCELVLDMGFVPALQDPASREHRGLLHSFNRTVSLGPGLSGGLWGGGNGLHPTQLPPPTGCAPVHVGAWLPAAGGDGDQVGARGAPRHPVLLGCSSRPGPAALGGCPGPPQMRCVPPQGGQRGAGVRRAVCSRAGAGAGAGSAPRGCTGPWWRPAGAGGGRCPRPAQRGPG